jgi:RNA polymerase sigma-70 factor (ECF subfamily)
MHDSPSSRQQTLLDVSEDGGDDVALIFKEHYRYVFRLATSLTGDYELAKDISQEVFIAVMNGLSNFRGESQLRTWLYQITIRISGRQLARRNGNSVSDLDPDDYPGIASAESAAQLVDLIAAINKLPLSSRTVLSLVSIEGISHEAASIVLGIPIGTVWSRLHTARKQLTEILQRNAK